MIYTLTLNPAIDRELKVAEIAYDTVLSALEARVDFGGKGFNVSRMLKSLGTPSTAVAFVGGNTGQRLKDGLAALGIESDFVWLAEETRTNISIVTAAHDRYIKVNEKGPNVPPSRQEELLEKIRAIARAGDWWVLAGSLPPGIGEDYYARIVRLLNDRGAVAVLDTSGEALRIGCREPVFLVKPNAEEARNLTGLEIETPAQAAEAAAVICEMGPQNVVISLGKTGALLQSGEHTWIGHPPVVEEKNPIGAGDSMVGAMVWAFAQGRAPEEALCWGVASGAAAASLSGTDMGSLDFVSGLREQVRLERYEPSP